MTTTPAQDRALLTVAVLASFVAFLDGSVVNLALPAISAQFGGGLALQQWVVDSYLLALGALILVAGAVSDALGRLFVLRMGVVVFGVASVLCALAPTGEILVVARTLQGLGAAFLVPSSLAMINGRFAGVAQARAIGIWTAWTGTAFVVGPVLGGLLVDFANWRWIFAVNVVPLAVTLVQGARTGDDAPRPRLAELSRIDVVGAVLAAVGLTVAVFALIELQRLGLDHPLVAGGLVAGVVCLTAFVWWERRAPHPMLPPNMFAQNNFAVGNLVTVFLYAGVSLGTMLVTLFLQETVGMSASLAGVATLPIPVASFLLAQRFGTLAGRHGPRVFMAVGPVLAGAGFALMATASTNFNFWLQMLPGLVLFGVGLSMTVSPLTAAVLAAVDPAQSGVGSAVNNAVSRVAGLVSVAFVGVIVGGTIDFDGFRRGMLTVAGLLVIAGVVAALGIRNVTEAHDVPLVASAGCHDRVTPPPGGYAWSGNNS